MKSSGAEGYNLSKLPEFESYVMQQVKLNQYDLDANIALLRFYNFSPERANIKITANILIKAMMQLPNPDFALLLHLVPERTQEEQPVAALIALTQHLEGARFQTFWLALDACRDVVNPVTGFYEAVRNCILQTICLTCQKVTKSLLAESLRMDGATLDALIEEKHAAGWRTVSGPSGRTIIVFPKMEATNAKQQSSTQGGFRFDSLAPLLAS